jgi:putative Ca2+/H+ antiporter (TMEM165/GDT1 family)
VAFGRLIALLPQSWVHLASGLVFLAFAAHSWLSQENEEDSGEAADLPRTGFWRSATKAFVVIFIAEWGDLTQIATASIAARNEEFLLTVFLASTLALWAVTAVAVVVGRRVGHTVPVGILHKVSAVLFAAIGLYFLGTWWN